MTTKILTLKTVRIHYGTPTVKTSTIILNGTSPIVEFVSEINNPCVFATRCQHYNYDDNRCNSAIDSYFCSLPKFLRSSS